MAEIFNITPCNIAQLIAESNRFLFQVLLVHVTTSIIEGKDEIFGESLFKALLITAMAILMYHIFFRKLVEPKLEKMKMICNGDSAKRLERVQKIHKKDPLRPKYRARLDHSIARHKNNAKKEKSDRSKKSDRTEKSDGPGKTIRQNGRDQSKKGRDKQNGEDA